jgi:hypothetical protein
MHDQAYQRALDHLQVADSFLSLWGFYLWEKRNAAQSQEAVPQADVRRQDGQ